ncbi:hypothetical protein [Priestia megaterium]|uniref:hypothetical protein n=1 Tax=Priestia megaterium TaxID=1404 RepID=UPI000BFC6F14|nr:hypothetical protein [Priestia megaterium]MBW0934211.1 hypothetical protein [Priestia megaterium]PGX80589.1 hypothetical protein COE31_04535 [Priestia megaterium]
MKLILGKFFIIQSLLTYLIMDTFYTPYKITDKPTVTDLKTGVTTVSYSSPGSIDLNYMIPGLIFVLGIYFILRNRKEQKYENHH